MPRIVGVIAEYNPFHLGHAHHLQEARKAARADHVVAVMSTCFTQRGDAALLSPADRTRMALAAGADAVFALPAVWAARDAEHFALGGVAILRALGCDAISFGSEAADIQPMQQAALLMEEGSVEFSRLLQERMAAGLPYPAAAAAAADALCPGAGLLLSQPNSTLAVCYLRALRRLRAEMEVCPVMRRGAYHATGLTETLPSATALRGAILRGDWYRAKAAMPEEAFRVLTEAASAGRIHRPAALDAALLYRLRTMAAGEYAALPDVSEGIEYRLQSAADGACTREALLQAAKTRRYPLARLSRLATHALLGLTHGELHGLPLPETPWLLGFRREARPLISLLAQRTPLLTRGCDLTEEVSWVPAEIRAHDVWALGAGLPAGLARTQGLIVL